MSKIHFWDRVLKVQNAQKGPGPKSVKYTKRTWSQKCKIQQKDPVPKVQNTLKRPGPKSTKSKKERKLKKWIKIEKAQNKEE